MISVDVASKSLGGQDILADIRFDVASGETLAVLGPSGIGKSTLLRLIAGTDTEFDGTIRCPGRIGMVFQEPTLLPWRSVLQNITLVHGRVDDAGARAALADVGLSGKADMFPGQLSLGQQRRLALARAFAGDPEVLLLDEPFVSLDPTLAEDMLTLTEALIAKSRPATIFVTHSAQEAERLGTRIIHLGGTPATIEANKGERT